MTLKLDIPKETEAGLLAQAHAYGLSLEDYAKQVLLERVQETVTSAKSDERPIWEVITNLVKDVPDEVFDRLPKDGASQVDHYIYGLPKRD